MDGLKSGNPSFQRKFTAYGLKEENFLLEISRKDYMGCINEHKQRISDEILAYLLKAPLFKMFRKNSITKVFVDKVELRIYKRGEYLIKEGETPANKIYMIKEGWVKVTKL